MAASCPGNPPAPAGYQVWRGAVPKELTEWAVDIRNHINAFPYGTIWHKEYGGQDVVARKDYHTWTYRGGQLLTGICIPGVTLYSARPGGSSLVDIGTADDSDPLATPDESFADALFDADSSAGQPPGPSWPLVAATGAAAIVVVGLFIAAIKYAGR